MIIVVGSGPSSVAAASSLLKRGCDVTMLDAGLTYTSNKVVDIDKYNRNFIKLSHGSDYVYDKVTDHISMVQDSHVNCMPSFAQGGLSNVWGAFTEFYDASQIKDWPLDISRLKPYYSLIEEILKPAKSSECANPQDTNIYFSSTQAKSLLTHWQHHFKKLHEQGMHFETAKLACKFSSSEKQLCTYCGSCQYGCPTDLIYSARHTLSYLLCNPRFKYIGNCIVSSAEEGSTHVQVNTYNLNTKKPTIYRASQVFIGCGPIISTKLALESMKIFEHTLSFLDSTHFILPCLMYKRINGVMNHPTHTLTQLCIKLANLAISPQIINLQLYTFMDNYLSYLKSKTKITYPIFKYLMAPLLERLVVIQGHLHSSDSHGFKMKFGRDNIVYINSILNNQTENILYKLKNGLKSNSRNLGFVPINLMFSASKIAKSFHYGGSLPMSKISTKFKTDIFGRPFEKKRLHIIDSTIFPSIPAGSITPTIMANAYRIAAECTLYE
jgi:choline dehydrogenase-like flavoprotein